jgi:hypothetical protein
MPACAGMTDSSLRLKVKDFNHPRKTFTAPRSAARIE